MSVNAKIYAHAYQLGLLVLERTRTFPKHYRPVLGRKLEESAVEIAIHIRHALMCPQSQKERRLHHLDIISDRVDEFRIVSQYCLDMGIIKPNPYNDMCELLHSVGKQLGGLRKYESP